MKRLLVVLSALVVIAAACNEINGPIRVTGY